MTVRVYRSTDASAPVLNGTAGSMIAVLDACLVNGYGALAGSGWTIPYTGTNLRAYRQPSGNQMYLRIADTLGANATVQGYETMTAISTGTNLFPTTAQVAAPGLYWYKSSQSAAQSIPWICVATQKIFYLWVAYNNAVAPTTSTFMYCFGDISTFKSTTDGFETFIMGSTTASSTPNSVSIVTSITTTLSGQYMARSYTGTGTSINVGKIADYVRGTGNNYIGYSLGSGSRSVFPDMVNGYISLSPVWITEPANSSVRGAMPGWWNLNHWASQQLPMLTPAQGVQLTFTNGAMNGKTIEFLPTDAGAIAIEVSDTW